MSRPVKPATQQQLDEWTERARARGAVGSDGLTPIQRLQARGYELDEKGSTIPIGYGPKLPGWEGQEVDWLHQHDPGLTLICKSTRKQVAEVWLTPDLDPERRVWYHSGGSHRVLSEWWSAEHDVVPVWCPEHGLALLPLDYVCVELTSTRRHAPVDCADPNPVYPVKT